MFCAATHIEAWKFKKKSFRNAEEAKRFTDYIELFKKMPLIIDSTPNLDIQNMRAVIQRVKLQYPNLGLVCIDYIQKMSGPGDNQNNIVSNISKHIKGIAKMYQVPIIVCAQLSRLCESRENKRPELSDLRDSGALEQDADIVAMLYRDYYYSRNQEHKHICEILIRKFRNGETGKVVVEYNVGTQSFKSIKPNTKLFDLSKRFYYE
jgi:replicative DNA helicase